MIKPTIGRVVWYWPLNRNRVKATQPEAAIVCFVHSDTCVNLSVFDLNGVQYNKTSVLLFQNEPGDERPEDNFAEWMPYQIGQAKKDATI